MVRSPCCEKMGLKKGPWTPEEDQILISYINQYGHENWRALPKQAGLLRCGKSCRLRWTNYLRPDIKRGNFSQEEEETIIKLHQALGNRWSAIAMRLPGRTDNEIKNFWHTRLKKKLMSQSPDGMVGTSQATSWDATASRPVMLSASAYHPHQDQHQHHHNHHHQIMGSQSMASSSSTSHTIEVEASSQKLDPGKLPPMTPPTLHFSDPPQFAVDVLNSTAVVTKNDDMAFWYNLFIRAGN